MKLDLDEITNYQKWRAGLQLFQQKNSYSRFRLVIVRDETTRENKFAFCYTMARPNMDFPPIKNEEKRVDAYQTLLGDNPQVMNVPDW